MTRWQASRRGLSLIEGLIILAVLAVLVGLALPRLDTAAFRADANARLVRTTLQQAQKRALDQKHGVIVSFDIPGGRVRVADDADNNRVLSEGEPVVWRTLTDAAHFYTPSPGINGPVSDAVTGGALEMLYGMPTVTFYRDGIPSSALEVYLLVKGGRGDAARGITLVQSTGRPEWFKRVGSQWRIVAQ